MRTPADFPASRRHRSTGRRCFCLLSSWSELHRLSKRNSAQHCFLLPVRRHPDSKTRPASSTIAQRCLRHRFGLAEFRFVEPTVSEQCKQCSGALPPRQRRPPANPNSPRLESNPIARDPRADVSSAPQKLFLSKKEKYHEKTESSDVDGGHRARTGSHSNRSADSLLRFRGVLCILFRRVLAANLK